MNRRLKVCRVSLQRKGVVLWWQSSLPLACKPLAVSSFFVTSSPSRPAYKIAEVLLPELLFKTVGFMTTSASFLSLFWQLMTLSEYVNPPLWFHIFPPCDISVSPRAFGVLFWILSLFPGIVLSHSFSFMSLTSWMMKTFSSPAENSFHVPL